MSQMISKDPYSYNPKKDLFPDLKIMITIQPYQSSKEDHTSLLRKNHLNAINENYATIKPFEYSVAMKSNNVHQIDH